MIDDDLISLVFEATMSKPRERPNVWVCGNPACPISPCWATSEDMAEVPKASDCMKGRPDYQFIQVKPMTGRMVAKEEIVIDVEPGVKEAPRPESLDDW